VLPIKKQKKKKNKKTASVVEHKIAVGLQPQRPIFENVLTFEEPGAADPN
jgi:hypothetical protein